VRRGRHTRLDPVVKAGIAILAALGLTSSVRGAEPAAAPSATGELAEVVIVAQEPRYVAPTNRDGIGRVWVPVVINDQGPFRLVLDTGATRSAVTANVAQALGIPTTASRPVLLRGSTGSAVAPTIAVQSMSVGDLWVSPALLPVVASAFGGAEGLLGMDGMQDKRIFIDFRNDNIEIARSRNGRAPAGFSVIPFLPNELMLLVVHARIGTLRVRAIIDTGAQATIGNTALQQALRRQVERGHTGQDDITGATGDVQSGVGANITSIAIGDITIRGAHVTFGDMHIFDLWKLGDEPALVIGMDILGLIDTLVIDYRRRELHIRPQRG
jgi:predicted aspartyl protease